MATKALVKQHIEALAQHYLAQHPDIALDDYLNRICRYCPGERALLRFIASGMTIDDLAVASPLSFGRLWSEANEAERKVIMIEVKLLLLKTKAEGDKHDYREACEHVAEIIGIGASARRYTAKQRQRFVGSLFAATQGSLRGSFVRDIVAVKSETVLTVVAAYYSAIEQKLVTSRILREEAKSF